MPYPISVAQAASRLGLPTWTAYLLCRSGALPHAYIGKQIAINPEAVHAFADSLADHD